MVIIFTFVPMVLQALFRVPMGVPLGAGNMPVTTFTIERFHILFLS